MTSVLPCPPLTIRCLTVWNPYIAHAIGKESFRVRFGDERVFHVAPPMCDDKGNAHFPWLEHEGKVVVLFGLEGRQGKSSIYQIFDKTLTH